MKPCMYGSGFPLWNHFGLCVVSSQSCFDPPSWQTCSLPLPHFVWLEMIHDTGVLQEWFGFHQWDNITALLNPHFHKIVQLGKKAACGSVQRDLVDIFAWPVYAISTGHCNSWWCISAPVEKLIQGRARQQPLVSSWEAQLSCPGLHLGSNVSSC